MDPHLDHTQFTQTELIAGKRVLRVWRVSKGWSKWSSGDLAEFERLRTFKRLTVAIGCA